MANVNLLPWRDEYRNEKKREFVLILLSLCLISLIFAFFWVSFTQASIANQEERNKILQDAIVELEEDVKEIAGLKKRREELETRISIIQGLQDRRPLTVRYFDEMVRAVPEGLFFSDLTLTGNVFEIKGTTESNHRVSTLMRNLDRSDWFEAPNLKSVIAENFEVTVESTVPDEEG